MSVMDINTCLPTPYMHYACAKCVSPLCYKRITPTPYTRVTPYRNVCRNMSPPGFSRRPLRVRTIRRSRHIGARYQRNAATATAVDQSDDLRGGVTRPRRQVQL